jgi:hypothetical protein
MCACKNKLVYVCVNLKVTLSQKVLTSINTLGWQQDGFGDGLRCQDDVRLFSTLTNIFNNLRNMLKAQHLTFCARRFMDSACSV